MLTAVAGGYNYRLDWNDPVNQPATGIRIPSYQCPSTPGTHILNPADYVPPPLNVFAAATSDYFVVTRANWIASVWTQVFGSAPGADKADCYSSVLTVNTPTSLQAISDGLSNTMMIGESAARQEGWSAGKMYADAKNLGFLAGAWGQESNNIVCAGTVAPVTAGVKPTGKVTSNLNTPGALTVNVWNQGELYSFHSSVVNVVFGDGSVRAIKSSISMSAMLKMAARADGMVNDPE